MKTFRTVSMATMAVATLSAVVAASPASATLAPVALWHMEETSGAVAVDSSGQGNDGALFNVALGREGYAGSGFSFNGSSSKIVVPSAPSLNPGARNFSVTVAVRLTILPPGTGETYDLVRKGVSSTSGGEYKMELANVKGTARARCVAKDSSGTLARETHPKSLADGAWHVITCSKTASVWAVTVDGVERTDPVFLGSISNSKALTIGAKNGGSTGGDWYHGDMDEVEVKVG